VICFEPYQGKQIDGTKMNLWFHFVQLTQLNEQESEEARLWFPDQAK